MKTLRSPLMFLLCLAGLSTPVLRAQVLPQPGGLAVDGSGRILVSFTGRKANGRTDLGVVVFDAAGKALGSRRVASSAPGATLGAAGLIVGPNSVTVGGSNAAPGTQSDLLVARFNHPPATSGVEGTAAAGGFDLAPAYPNPLRGAAAATLGFRLDQSSHVRVTLLDAAGRVLSILRDEQTPPGEYHLRVSLADRPAGMYFIEVRRGGTINIARLLKQ